MTKLAFPTDIISNDNISQTSNSSESRRYLGKVIWFFSTSRNILVVLISALVAYLFDVYAVRPFVLLGIYNKLYSDLYKKKKLK